MKQIINKKAFQWDVYRPILWPSLDISIRGWVYQAIPTPWYTCPLVYPPRPLVYLFPGIPTPWYTHPSLTPGIPAPLYLSPPLGIPTPSPGIPRILKHCDSSHLIGFKPIHCVCVCSCRDLLLFNGLYYQRIQQKCLFILGAIQPMQGRNMHVTISQVGSEFCVHRHFIKIAP